jgi:uncharacterized RDD family membrane protein YckC
MMNLALSSVFLDFITLFTSETPLTIMKSFVIFGRAVYFPFACYILYSSLWGKMTFLLVFCCMAFSLEERILVVWKPVLCIILSHKPSPQLEYAGNYAGVGMRFLALLIDSILLGVAGGILLVFFRLLLGSPAGTAVASLVGSVVGIVYCIGLEATQGATLGKKMLGLRVVKTDGSAIGWPEAFIRYLLRIVDLMLVIPIGAILIWITPQHQRLGDFVAHTIVISNRC